ncbi:glutathione S-transferase family protein [Phenylobacterium sp.]|uniref:glutathione S-transferase family protein n=1 Tax=Phenylobacterium sp. TaxID=1871053 RepID=UPI0025CC6848|nr:glutathione S-transferase family protein [Phenylobacterium sp.]MBX3485608.1 glutathione S-transferase [Phenylobacterium sp.]
MHAAAERFAGPGDGPFVLYGAYASFYTGKTRSYLRKKGIPFVERLPSHPRFRQEVSPAARSKRIPILETPEGHVIQDTTAIFEYLERRFPDPPALPPGPRQRLAAYLVDLFASEGLKVAWHYRWNFPAPNRHFVVREFGRSFKPQGSDELLDHYGEVVAARMDGHRPRLGITPELFPVMEAIYFEILDTLEAHFTTTPYLFGGLPSVGDHGLMGPLFAHLGRDPWPLHVMQQRAPRVFRWVEHMNAPEIVSPEFWDTPEAYLPDDEVPETVKRLIRMFCVDNTPIYHATATLYRDWVEARPYLLSGSVISDDDEDQPNLGPITTPLRGHSITAGSPAHALWVLQRTLDWLRALPPAERAAADALAAEVGATELLSLDLVRPLTRVGNRLAVA